MLCVLKRPIWDYIEKFITIFWHLLLDNILNSKAEAVICFYQLFGENFSEQIHRHHFYLPLNGTIFSLFHVKIHQRNTFPSTLLHYFFAPLTQNHFTNWYCHTKRISWMICLLTQNVISQEMSLRVAKEG